MSLGRRIAALVAASGLSLAVLSPALADPPSWAPAHGWRAKHGTRTQSAILIPTERRTVVTCDRSLLSENSTLIGQILGGAAGALAGSQFGQGTGKLAATAGGTLLGVLMGGKAAEILAPADAACAQYALNSAPKGQTVAWTDPDSNRRYRVTPTDEVAASGSQYCREYTSAAVVDGKTTTTYGTACRQPDGQWKIVN